MATQPQTKVALDKPKRVRAKKAAPATETFVAFKGFDSTLACRGHQYEVGKTYVHAGQVVQCSSGFHVCQNPLDVLDFYPLENGNRFARVTVGGKIDRSDDKKWAAAEITVSAELTFPAFVKAAIDWTVAACKASRDGTASSGDSAKNASSGYSAKNASSGDYAKNASSGDYAKNASSGESATNASSGDYAKNVSSGYSTKNVSSGYYATNASSGDYATNASSGDYAKNASSGDYATNASGGDYAKNASSGDYAKNASSGDYAKNASSGDYATNEATGKHAVIASAGRNSRAKGATGAWISLAEYDGLICIGFATGCAGKGGVPADTWLIAKGGKLVAA
jgi:hypothetical protein